ncbi:O-acetyltransferase OatA [Brevundimonas subvibrioides]|uniref:acyltransferase family protein n=1 Tax=Brevundimonas subvibrioides TaxID=74313 RepID=UPI0032D59F7C
MGPVRYLLAAPQRWRRLTASGSYVPQIDGLRFLAIAPVLMWHAGLRGQRMIEAGGGEASAMPWLPHGHVGVDLFFFISGYIIAYPFLAGKAPGLVAFARRRLLRLEPPYLLVMVGCFLALALTGLQPTGAPSFYRTEAPLWQSLAASSVYMHGLIFNGEPRLNPPAWSLEVEIQFYILAPLLLFAYTRIRSRTARLWTGAICVVFALVGGQWILDTLGYDNRVRWTLLTHAYPFLLGILVSDWAIEARPFEKEGSGLADLFGVLGLVLLLATGLFEESRSLEVGLIKDSVRAVAILLIFWLACRGRIGRAALGNGWIALIGGACYSIYLVHVPIMQAVTEVIVLLAPPTAGLGAWIWAVGALIPAGLVGGLIFYVLIERPCTRPDWPARLAARLTGGRAG